MTQLYMLYTPIIANALDIIDNKMITQIKVEFGSAGEVEERMNESMHGDNEHHATIPAKGTIYEIISSNRRTNAVYYVIGLTTCTCEAFHFEASSHTGSGLFSSPNRSHGSRPSTSSNRRGICKHLLACWIADAIGEYDQRTMGRKEMGAILMRVLLSGNQQQREGTSYGGAGMTTT